MREEEREGEGGGKEKGTVSVLYILFCGCRRGGRIFILLIPEIR